MGCTVCSISAAWPRLLPRDCARVGRQLASLVLGWMPVHHGEGSVRVWCRNTATERRSLRVNWRLATRSCAGGPARTSSARASAQVQKRHAFRPA